MIIAKDLCRVAADVKEFIKPEFEQKGIRVNLECPGDEHDSILRIYAENQRIHKRRVIVTEFPTVHPENMSAGARIKSRYGGIDVGFGPGASGRRYQDDGRGSGAGLR